MMIALPTKIRNLGRHEWRRCWWWWWWTIMAVSSAQASVRLSWSAQSRICWTEKALRWCHHILPWVFVLFVCCIIEVVVGGGVFNGDGSSVSSPFAFRKCESDGQWYGILCASFSSYIRSVFSLRPQLVGPINGRRLSKVQPKFFGSLMVQLVSGRLDFAKPRVTCDRNNWRTLETMMLHDDESKLSTAGMLPISNFRSFWALNPHLPLSHDNASAGEESG